MEMSTLKEIFSLAAVYVAIGGLFIWFAKWMFERLIKDYDERQSSFVDMLDDLKSQIGILKDEIQAHVDECNKVPKSLIAEQIQNLEKMVDRNHQENARTMDDFRLTLRDFQSTILNFHNTILKSIGRRQP